MSLLRYTVTVQFDVDATDTDEISGRLITLQSAGSIVETKAKAVAPIKERKVKPIQA